MPDWRLYESVISNVSNHNSFLKYISYEQIKPLLRDAIANPGGPCQGPGFQAITP